MTAHRKTRGARRTADDDPSIRTGPASCEPGIDPAAYQAWCRERRGEMTLEPIAGGITDLMDPPPALMGVEAARTVIMREAHRAADILPWGDPIGACERFAAAIVSLLEPVAVFCNAYVDTASSSSRAWRRWIPGVLGALDGLGRAAILLRKQVDVPSRRRASAAAVSARVVLDAQMTSLEGIAAPIGWRQPATLAEAEAHRRQMARMRRDAEIDAIDDDRWRDDLDRGAQR